MTGDDGQDKLDYAVAVPPTIDVPAPGEPLLVWAGMVHRPTGGTDVMSPDLALAVPGELRLVWRRKFTVEWHLLDPDAAHNWRRLDWDVFDPELGFEYANVVSPLPVQYIQRNLGWTNGGALGRRDALLTEVRTLLLNMPTIHCSQMINDPATRRSWNGRFETNAAGWTVTIDAVPDQHTVFETARQNETYAVTHTVRLTRTDGTAFAPGAAASVAFALQLALSFAAGYWVGLAGTTGYDVANGAVWCEVGAPHVGRAQRGTGWWVASRPGDLADYLSRFFGQWDDPAPTDPLRFAATSSVLAGAEGFVEQRIVAAISAIETLSWAAEVVQGSWSESQWNRNAARRIRRLLRSMKVDSGYSNAPGKAALTSYGRKLGYHDLAETVVEVRHRITHPRPDHDIYSHNGLLLEAWRHAATWLELAILHRLGFDGRAVDHTVPRQWVGESEWVPWSTIVDDPDLDS